MRTTQVRGLEGRAAYELVLSDMGRALNVVQIQRKTVGQGGEN